MPTIYVAPDGDDGADGRTPETPLATLDAASEAAREAAAGGMDEDVTVALRGGTYYREEPLVLGPADSGRDGHRVVYTNYADEEPVVVGGTPVTGWEHHEGGVYRADVDHEFDLLYEDGRRAELARYPDEGYSRVAERDGDAPCRRFGYAPGDVPETGADENLQVHVWPGGPGGEWNWFSDVLDVASVDRDANAVELAGETRYELGAGSRYFVQNALEFLSRPGEFYLDREAGTLYYWPRGDVEDAEVIAPRVESVVECRGRSTAERVHDVRIEGLTLAATDRTHPVGSVDGESTEPRGAIHLTNARDVTVARSRIRATGLDAVAGLGATERVAVEHCRLHDVGHTGVRFRGSVAAAYGNRNNRVLDTHVHDVGRVVGHGHGISLHHSGNCELSHNRIHHCSRFGIEVTSMPRPTTMTGLGNDDGEAMEIDGVPATPENVALFQHARNNVVAHNDVSHCNLDSQDNGLIYTNTGGRGNVVHGNRLHHSQVPFSFGFGLYLDDTSDGVAATNNVIHDLNHEGDGELRYAVYAKGLDDRLANNVVAHNAATVAAFGSHEHGGTYNRDQVLERNVVADSGPNVHGFSNWSTDRIARSERNVFFHPDGEYGVHGVPSGYAVDGDSHRVETLSEWREAFGHDEESVAADPRFLAPENDDYRLRYDSPAWPLGFQPIDHAAVGLLADHPFAEDEPVARAFPRVAGVHGTPSHVELPVGGTADLSVTARTETGYVADADVTFESADPDVAAVDDDGTVTAVGAGVARVTATVAAGGGTVETPVDVLVGRSSG